MSYVLTVTNADNACNGDGWCVTYIGDHMNRRDREYLINRLTYPAPELIEAIERLSKLGYDAESKQLREAYTEMMATVRTVRQQL